jgi:hypothetical protein
MRGTMGVFFARGQRIALLLPSRQKAQAKKPGSLELMELSPDPQRPTTISE